MAVTPVLESTLEATPTWAVAAAAFFFVTVSLLMERGIHRFSSFLKKNNQKPLKQAVRKMTEELMLLGFISLLLTVLQQPISKICIPMSVANHWLPCKFKPDAGHAAAPKAYAESHSSHSRKMLMFVGQYARRKLLASGGSECYAKGKVPFLSAESLHQLHIFIFVLAVVHVVYSCLTMVLGFAKMHVWRKWEVQIREANYDPLTALRETVLQPKPVKCLARQSVHGQSAFVVWTRCFLGQFVGRVSKSDYMTFRLAFITNHHLSNTFNFHDYVIRSMETDFQVVVGISSWLWAFVVVFLLLNVHDWYAYFWMAFIPLFLVLVVGTKQQHIISVLATEARNDALASKVDDTSQQALQPLSVRTRDELFWFNYPVLLLLLIHFILFQNAFELGVFFWLWATFGWQTCFFDNRELVIIRLIIGVLTQILCSYSTLPLYALVTQMGSDYKPAIFKKSVHSALHGWHGKAKQKQKAKAKPAEGNILDSINPLIWTRSPAREMKQVNPPEDLPAPQAQEIKQGQQEPLPAVTAPRSEEETAGQKAIKEKFVRLYNKVGGSSKAQTLPETV